MLKVPPDVLKMSPESEWAGVVPIFYSLSGLNFSVPTGPGGWGASVQNFKVRGRRYLVDGVKVCSLLCSLITMKC